MKVSGWVEEEGKGWCRFEQDATLTIKPKPKLMPRWFWLKMIQLVAKEIIIHIPNAADKETITLEIK